MIVPCDAQVLIGADIYYSKRAFGQRELLLAESLVQQDPVPSSTVHETVPTGPPQDPQEAPAPAASSQIGPEAQASMRSYSPPAPPDATSIRESLGILNLLAEATRRPDAQEPTRGHAPPAGEGWRPRRRS